MVVVVKAVAVVVGTSVATVVDTPGYVVVEEVCVTVDSEVYVLVMGMVDVIVCMEVERIVEGTTVVDVTVAYEVLVETVDTVTIFCCFFTAARACWVSTLPFLQ